MSDKALTTRDRLATGDAIIIPIEAHVSADGTMIEFSDDATFETGDEFHLRYTVTETGIVDPQALKVIPMGYPVDRGRPALSSTRARRSDARRSGPR